MSIVFDEPPAPAARDEFGFCTVLLVALRLERTASKRQREKCPVSIRWRDVATWNTRDVPDLSTGWLGYSRRRSRLAVHGWG